jgi:hypothetical protein
MAQLSLQDGIIQIIQEELANTSGSFNHSGDLTVTGTVTADTIKVKNLVTENGAPTDSGQWTFNTEQELNGKGFSWTWGEGSYKLSYRTGERIWASAHIDLAPSRSYKIDNVDVLSAGTLGSSIIKSNLRQIGVLQKLEVSGHANIGGWAIFTESNRLGLGTEQPNGTLSIVDQDIEMVLTSTNVGVANIGTYTNHDVSIITDNISRVIVKKNGEVHIGDENFKNGVLKVYGTIEAESIVTDNRVERNSSLEFKATRTSNVYNIGLVWKNQNSSSQLVLLPGPNRFWSSESLDLNKNCAYHIDGQSVLSNTALGNSVVQSNLTKLGTLQSLTVQGTGNFLSELVAHDVIAKSVNFNDGTNSLAVNNLGLAVNKNLSITVQGIEELYLDRDEIVIGNKQNTRRPVKVFGPLSVGVNNPDPSLSLAVSGNMSFAGRKFITGSDRPSTGSHTVGDICWNDNPRADSYVGWVCVVEGDPGVWLPFGSISRQ